VPKRKAGADILAVMEAEKAKPLGRAPGRMPQNRNNMIEDLQERFQFKDKDELDRHFARQRMLAEKASTEYVMDDKTRRRERFALKISKNSL
jgi:hypothetical protein